MLTLDPELLAHVLETCARRAAFMFRGLAIDDDAPAAKAGRSANDAKSAA
jgi:hypothetical protein